MPTDKEKKESDELVMRIEKQLDEIDTSEFLNDATRECLEEKGILGDKKPLVERKIHKTDKERLVFEAGVEFTRLSNGAEFDKLKIGSFLKIKDVEKGLTIASRSILETAPFYAGNNVAKKEIAGIEYYTAKVKGKALIIRDSLYVFPSDIPAEISVTINKEKTYAYIDCAPAYGAGTPLTASDVEKELKKQGICFGILEKNIQEAVDSANQTHLRKAGILVAQGKPPIPGERGKIEYQFTEKPDENGIHILPDGRVDYRKTKVITTAEQDQLLAKIIAPRIGTPGKNILGETIPAPDGKPVRLATGRGVRTSENGKEYFAVIQGCIISNGSVLDVVPVFAVNGDVDFSTGNIKFNGTVLVNGTVRDGFEVKAEGDIIVTAIVESARLEAGRDIVIKGGAQGKGKGLISAGRDIRIGYAQNARLEAQGDIYIANYAINSYIFTSKNIIMNEQKGAIIGGEVFALKGIEVLLLGSENGSKTFVDAGTDYLVKRRMGEIDDAIKFCKANVSKIEDSLKTLAVRMKTNGELSDAMKRVVEKALEKKKDLEERLSIMVAKRADLYEQAQSGDECLIKVKRRCYPDVTIKIKEFKMVVTKSRDNVRFYEDVENGEIAVGVY
jgi:uncharacterized protein (DUF342 family)